MSDLSVLLVEDSVWFRQAFASLFSENAALNLRLCTSGALLKRKGKINQDAVLIDAVTWTAGTQTLADVVRQTSTIVPVILLGRDDLLDRHLEVVRAGAVGFLKQTASAREIVKAAKAATQGQVWFEKHFFQKLVLETWLSEEKLRTRRLNQREERILNLVAKGKTNKEISVELGTSERTIKAHVSSLFRKIGVPNRAALASYGVRYVMG